MPPGVLVSDEAYAPYDRAQPLDDDAPPLFSGVTQFAGGGEYAVRASLAPTTMRLGML